MILLLLACADPPEELGTPPRPDVPWVLPRPALNQATADGRALRRAIIHLHSPISHDACDGHDMADEPCLADLRAGLCDAAIDVAFLTDHPSMAAEKSYEQLFNLQPGDELLAADGSVATVETGAVASRMTCEDGHTVTVRVGIEDELMPVGLDRQVGDSAEENDTIYNEFTAESLAATLAAGAVPLQAHTEGKTLEELLERQSWGQAGTEIFNLHAMVDPTKREQDLGLEAMAYLTDAGPFIAGTTDAEPDLVFLAIYEEQAVSLERWDALNALAPSLGTGGTDAHENALPMPMSDGERVDSYRRMVSWFSNYLVVDADTPGAYETALVQRQTFLAFDVLGTPSGFDVAYEGQHFAVDSAPVGGELSVACPTVSAESPWQGEEYEVIAQIYRDGVEWQRGCGAFAVSEPGVYRVRVDIVPHHLAGFMGDLAPVLEHSYPWLYSQAFRIGL
jgi:hypothetical protein